MPRSKLRLLLLGGTTEASALARALADDPLIDATISLAGRTSAPLRQPLPMRIGGFGGADGLAAFLRAQAIEAVVDATHPFAATITANAVRATHAAGVPLLVLCRPPWTSQPGDGWTEVADLHAAAEAIGEASRRVLLTIGRGLSPFVATNHQYLIRTVDPLDPEILPHGATVLTARGPFALDDEIALLRHHRIELLVTKNSGGTATFAKLVAARALGIPAIIVARPPLPEVPTVPDVEEALAWLHDVAGRKRGV